MVDADAAARLFWAALVVANGGAFLWGGKRGLGIGLVCSAVLVLAVIAAYAALGE